MNGFGAGLGGFLLAWGAQPYLDRWIGHLRQSTAPWLDEPGVWVAAWRSRFPLLLPLLGALMTGETLTQLSGVRGWWVLGLEWLLLILAFIDLELQLLPDRVILPTLVLGLSLAWLGWGAVGPVDSLLGTLLGYGLLALVSRLFRGLAGYPGLGAGDGKLLALLGAWLGVGAIPWVLLWAALSGVVAGVLLRLTHGEGVSYPFGPFLVLGGMIMLWWDILGRGL